MRQSRLRALKGPRVVHKQVKDSQLVGRPIGSEVDRWDWVDPRAVFDVYRHRTMAKHVNIGFILDKPSPGALLSIPDWEGASRWRRRQAGLHR